MTTYYLLTGSNMGDAYAYLQLAAVLIQKNIGEITLQSAIYRTAPWGNTDQQDFLNQVLELQTEMTPEKVLQTILQIEQEMGRTRLHKWEPRIIDIDILFTGDTILQTPELTIPHPLIHERRFSLVPMAELAPNFVHPILNKTILSLLADCRDMSSVEKI